MGAGVSEAEAVAAPRVAPRVVVPMLAIATAVPLAVVLLAEDRLQAALPSVRLAELPMAAVTVGRLALVAAVAAGLAGPVAAWLTRVVRPWLVLLGALAPIGVAYLLASHVGSVGALVAARVLVGAGAGAVLGATAGLVGGAEPAARRYLAGAWAAALAGAGAARARLGVADPTNLREVAGRDWRELLRPYPWLLIVAAVLALALAAYSIKDPPPREPRRPADWLALLPLAPGAVLAVLAWTLPRSPGVDALLFTALVVACVAATAGPAVLRAAAYTPEKDAAAADPGATDLGATDPGATGPATAAVAFVAGGALVATVASVTAPGRSGYLLQTIGEARGELAALAAAAGVGALAAVAGAVAGAVLPADRRRSGILAGLVTAAAGAALLLPASDRVATSLPGLVLLAAGCGLALAAVLRAAGPLTAAVAGGLAAVALPAFALTTGRLNTWRILASGDLVDSDLDKVLAALHRASVQADRWWVALLIILLLAATLAVSRAFPEPQPTEDTEAE